MTTNPNETNPYRSPVVATEARRASCLADADLVGG